MFERCAGAAGKPILLALLVGGLFLAAGPVLSQVAPLRAPHQAPLLGAIAGSAPLDLLPADPGKDFEFKDATGRGATFVLAGEQGGKPLFRADNPAPAADRNGISVRWPVPHAVRKGDVVLVRFVARALKARQESGEAEALVTFMRADGGTDRSVQAFAVCPDWTLVTVPVTVPDDAAAGEAVTMIGFANLEQTFELTGLEVLSFGKVIKAADLPLARISYQGREADAPWRRAAFERIERLRTAPLTVRVLDAAGKPVAGARVKAAMTRSAFVWGSEVNADYLVGTGPDADRYRQAVAELFDVTVLGNALKWPDWRRPGGREKALKALDWLASQGKLSKGHNLVWPGWKFSPEDIVQDPRRGDKIGALVDAHIKDISAATRGRLIGWDVVNEPLHETDYFKHLPRDQALARWFALAARSNPGAQLTINEYKMLNSSLSPHFIADYVKLIRTLREKGVRIDLVGAQGHVGKTPRAPVMVLSDLDLLADGGRNTIQVTEYDFNTQDEALQADYNRDFLIALYSHPAVSGFIQWGSWEGAQWKPDAAMIRRDWSAKPSLQVWKDLVLDQRRTRIDGASTRAGELQARGHLGRYAVRVSHGCKQAKATVDLRKGGSTVVLRLR